MKRHLLQFILALFTLGCHFKPIAPGYEVERPPRAILITPNIAIDFVDDGFEVKTNDQFTPPRVHETWLVKGSTLSLTAYGKYMEERGCYGLNHIKNLAGEMMLKQSTPGSPARRAGMTPSNAYSLNGHRAFRSPEEYEQAARQIAWSYVKPGDTLDYKIITAEGDREGQIRAEPCAKGTHVRVRRGRDTFYGYLVFFHVASTAPPAVRRGYTIDIPGEYLAQARNGLVSVVYQPYQFTTSARSLYGNETTAKAESAAWALWLSDRPLVVPGGAPAPAPPRSKPEEPSPPPPPPPSPEPTPTVGCTKDSDCKGDRICGAAGECVAPKPKECTKDTDCPGDEVCEASKCVLPR